MTLAQLDALIKRCNEVQEKQDFRAGLICAVIANAPYKKRNFTPRDFMPGGKKNQKGKLPTLDEIRLMNAAAGGKDIPQEVDTSKLSQRELKRIVKNIKRTGRPDG